MGFVFGGSLGARGVRSLVDLSGHFDAGKLQAGQIDPRCILSRDIRAGILPSCGLSVWRRALSDNAIFFAAFGGEYACGG